MIAVAIFSSVADRLGALQRQMLFDDFAVERNLRHFSDTEA